MSHHLNYAPVPKRLLKVQAKIMRQFWFFIKIFPKFLAKLIGVLWKQLFFSHLARVIGSRQVERFDSRLGVNSKCHTALLPTTGSIAAFTVVRDKNRWSPYLELITSGLSHTIPSVVHIRNSYPIWSLIGGMPFPILFSCENCPTFVKNILILTTVSGELWFL